MEHYEAIRRGEEMARLASSAELEVSDKGPTTSTVSLLTNLGLMAQVGSDGSEPDEEYESGGEQESDEMEEEDEDEWEMQE